MNETTMTTFTGTDMLSEFQIATLMVLRRYIYATTAQIRNKTRPKDKDGSDTRRCIRGLGDLVRKHQPKMVNPLFGNSTAPIYAITMKGASALVAATGDPSYFLAAEPSFVQWMSLWHYVALTSIHMTIDEAFARQQYAKQTCLVFEHEVCDASAADPSDKFRLQTTVAKGPRPIFFCPDSAFETDVEGKRRVWFVENEMGSDMPKRVFAKKHRGAFEFAKGNFLKAMFPQSSSFRILCVTPNAAWRDALRKDFATHSAETQPDQLDKSGSEYWLFVSVEDVTVEKFLHEPILFTAKSGPVPFIKRPESASDGRPERRPGEGAKPGALPDMLKKAELL